MTAAKVTRIPAAKPAPRKKASPSAAARQAEATDGYVTIEQCGVTLQIPVGDKMPLAAIDAFLVGDTYEGNKRVLGEAQWKLLCDAGATRGDLDELAAKLKDASGN